MKKCFICQKTIKPFIFLGKQPIANGFLLLNDFKKEYFYNLGAGYCPNCFMVQLTQQVDAQKMFHENYAFYSGTSVLMKDHFKEFAKDVQKKYLNGPKPFVVEIGSNDGIMLQNFSDWHISHLGIEPSSNVAKVAKDKGINTWCEFFNSKLADKIINEYGKVDAILSANTMCQFGDIKTILIGVEKLLKDKGVLIFEDPYIGDILKKTSYDQIYDEHVLYFSALSVQNLAKKYGLELINVEHQEVHGGELRYTLAKGGAYKVSSSVADRIGQEKKHGLNKFGVYKKFRQNVEQTKKDLMELLNKLKKQKKTVIGYAATSKSTTVINYFGITPNLLEYISDTTPIKQGKFSPGMHIPIKPYETFKEKYPDYALLFAWNHGKEIMAKEKEFISSGGKWIVYVPKVKIVK